MPYNPGISYRGDLHISNGFRGLGRGIEQAGASMGDAMKERKEIEQKGKSAKKAISALQLMGHMDGVDPTALSDRDAIAMLDGGMQAAQYGMMVQQSEAQRLMNQQREDQMNAPPWKPTPVDMDGDGTPDMLMTSPSSAVPVPRPDGGGFSPYQQYQMERNFQQDRNRLLGGTSTLPGENVDQYVARTYDSSGKLVGKVDPMFEQHIDYLNEQARALGRRPVFERPLPVEELMGGPGAPANAQEKVQDAVDASKGLVGSAQKDAPPEVLAALKWLNDNADDPAASGVRARLVREGYLKQ